MQATLLTRLSSACAFLMAAVSAAAYDGAIFTSLPDGARVNHNIYSSKNLVYLNGGPQNQGHNGMPDGIYYFQVTNPNGDVLLSTDPAANRVLMVYDERVCGVGEFYLNGGIYEDPQNPYFGRTLPLENAHPEGLYNPANESVPVKMMPFDDTPNPGGEYKVWLIPVDAATIAEDGTHLIFSNSDAKTDNFKVRNPEEPPGPPQTELTIVKFYDTNANGIQDPGEPLIVDWLVHVHYEYTVDGVLYTYDHDATTPDVEEVPVGADVTVFEYQSIAPPTWYATTPVSFSFVEPLLPNTVTFGNVAIGANGGGLTLGFWSNKNGQARMSTFDWRALLNPLHLRDAAGSDMTWSAYAPFRSWLLGASATNMSYMLSAQLAAMELNVGYGNVNAGSIVYAPGVPSANALGFTTISALMADAEAYLTAHPVVLGGNPDRNLGAAIKDAIDGANNNGPSSFVYQPIVDPITLLYTGLLGGPAGLGFGSNGWFIP